MPVDKLRAFGKGMARKEVLEIEHFLFLVIDKIKHLELSENDARNLSFVYHRLWWFRKHLIETCMSDSSFDELASIPFDRFKSSAHQDIQSLLTANPDFKSRFDIPEVLRKDIQNTLNFFANNETRIGADLILHLEKSGNLWHTDQASHCYKMTSQSKRHKIVSLLAQSKDFLKPDVIANKVGATSVQILRNEIGKIKANIHKELGITDFILTSTNGEGYKINTRYQVIPGK